MSNIIEETKLALEELLANVELHKKSLCVVGCSTSEVVGGVIGKNGSKDAGSEIATSILEISKAKNFAVAAQCCEHLNRCLVVERETAEILNLEEVTVIPQPTAGGNFATAMFKMMKDPVVVENVKADFGIDIGMTMIGMHLKPVAVPLRLENHKIGKAHVGAAKSRPKLVGGIRAKYE